MESTRSTTPATNGRDDALDPEARLLQQHTVARVREALEQLPADFREVLVLREIEGCPTRRSPRSFSVPIGTVMSRLARGRERLLAELKLSPPLETLP